MSKQGKHQRVFILMLSMLPKRPWWVAETSFIEGKGFRTKFATGPFETQEEALNWMKMNEWKDK